MNTLYEIDAALLALMANAESYAEEFAGEIPEDLGDKIDALEMAKGQKILDIGRLIKSLTAEAAMVRVEEKRLAARRQALDNKVDWLKGYLQQHMGHEEKYRDSAVVIGWHTSRAVEADEAQVPDKYWKVKRELSKSLIADDIKAGVAVPGATIVERKSITIR